MTQQYAPLDLCKKLQEMGCVSESNYFYIEGRLIEVPFHWKDITEYERNKLKIYSAYNQNDFSGCHEAARENSKIIWGEPSCTQDMGDGWVLATADIGNWHRKRHALIDYTEGPWFEYLVKTMRAKEVK